MRLTSAVSDAITAALAVTAGSAAFSSAVQGRLRRAGYVEFGPSGIRLTATGRDVAERAAAGARTVSDELKAVEALLGTRAWIPGEDPRKARGNEPELITSDEHEAAVRAYRDLLRARA